MNAHPQSWLSLENLGSSIPPYCPTYDYPPPFIDRTHRGIAQSPLKDGLVQIKDRRWFGKVIPGWLRLEDALKLYEMAFFADGDILELGSYHGLSTNIIARACRNSSPKKQIVSIDLDPTCTKITRTSIDRSGLRTYVTTITMDAVSAVADYEHKNKQFAFVFIDHSHAYQPVFEVCKSLHHIVVPGGFCLFHDFNDIRNSDPLDIEYGVFQAVQEGLDKESFDFFGIYGCTGLYRRNDTPDS